MLSCASKRSTVIMDSCRHMQPPAPWADLCNEQRDWQSVGAGLALGEGHIHQGWLPDAHFCLFEVKTLLGYHWENNYLWLDADANERKRRGLSYRAYFIFVSAIVHTDSPSPNRSFWSISGPAMLVEACVDELSNTILSHTGLTSSTSDKPILFLHRVITMSQNHIILCPEPAPADVRDVDSSLWHLYSASKRK